MHRSVNTSPKFYCIILFQFLMPAAYSQWVNVGGNISHNQTYAANYGLAADTSGIPYVAFADMGNSYVVTVKKLDFGWVNVGTPGFITGTGNSGLFYSPGIAIAVNPIDNNPWIALADGDHDNKISVMRFNGTSWVYVGAPGFTNQVSCGVKIGFTSDGTAYIVYNACFDGGGISVMRYANNSWNYAGPSNFASGNYFNMVIAPNDRISVAYQDFNNDQKLTIRSLVSGSWIVNGTAGISDGEVQNVNITADAANDLYVCYVDYSLNNRLRVKKFMGNVWSDVGAGNVSQFAAGLSDISINRFGIPYVSYVDGSLPTVKKFTNGTWNPVANFVAAGQSHHTSIFNDSLGNPWVLTSLSPSLTLPFMYQYKPCNDADYGFVATATLDSAITQTGATTTVTVAASGGVGPYTGTGTFVVSAGYYNYTITDANGCSKQVDINVTEPQPVCEENYWTGAISTDWNDVSNWSCGSLPGDVTTVYVEPGAPYYPVVNSAVILKQLIISTGVTITVASGGNVTLIGQ